MKKIYLCCLVTVFSLEVNSETVLNEAAVIDRLVVGSGTASGTNSVAIGPGTMAFGNYSCAEGTNTMATGIASHAQGGLTLASGNYSHAEGRQTVAGGNVSYAGGRNAYATNDNTFVWSDGSVVGSTASNQFTVCAENGIRLLGGVIEGNGAGLTNVTASEFYGKVSVGQLPSSGYWDASGLAIQNVNLQGYVSSEFASRYFVRKRGDSLYGPFEILARKKYPSLTIFGASDTPKRVRFANSDDEVSWDISMGEDIKGWDLNRLVFRHLRNNDPTTARTVVTLGTDDMVTINYLRAQYSLSSGTCKANGKYSIALGYYSVADGDVAYACGEQVKALAAHSYAVGYRAETSNDYSYVWSSGPAVVGSTASRQYTVYAENGIRLLGGEIEGNGSGLTNLNLEAYTGDHLLWKNGRIYIEGVLCESNLTAVAAAKWPHLDTDFRDDFKSDAPANVLTGDLNVQGAFVATYVPPQGDLSMGPYTAGASE